MTTKLENSELLLRIMKEKNIVSIVAEYSGSGDQGSIDSTSIKDAHGNSLIDSVIDDLAETLLEDIVSPDYNNEGCYGTAEFTIKDGKLYLDCDHEEYYIDSKTTSYKEIIA
jgi:hypothetical protein